MVVERFMLPLLLINQEYSHPARVESVDIPGIDCDVCGTGVNVEVVVHRRGNLDTYLGLNEAKEHGTYMKTEKTRLITSVLARSPEKGTDLRGSE
jgi:hypothetical protein